MQKDHVHTLLQKLKPISLDGLDSVKLLNRVDRKYIIPMRNLSEIIELLHKDYSVLEIDGRRVFSYETIYFDTNDFRFYRDHHNSVSNRIKVRTRTYKDSNLHFFEIKMKTNMRTKKVRKKLLEPCLKLSEKQHKKVRKLYTRQLDGSLVPALINSYSRITLVNKDKTERCTIDVNLSYRTPEEPHKEINVDDIAIIEVKQSKSSLLNGIIASLRTIRIYPSSISKYVLGLILTRPHIKHNSFKPLLLTLDKIKQQYNPFNNIQKSKNHEKVTIPATSLYLS